MDQNIIVSAVTALATTIGAKVIESPVQSLNNLWDGIIGHRLAAWSEQKKLLHFQNIKLFKQDLADGLNNIPLEFIQDPKLSIVGPALEASKYYFEEEDLRKMFAKLIVTSMDSRENDIVQHSFVEIIKQLTPLDAKILRSYTNGFPIANLTLKTNKTGRSTIYSDFYVSQDFPDSSQNSISLNNLDRLGLLKIEYTVWLVGESDYEYIENTSEYSDLNNYIEFYRQNSDIRTRHIQKGIASMTNFGAAFKKVCID